MYPVTIKSLPALTINWLNNAIQSGKFTHFFTETGKIVEQIKLEKRQKGRTDFAFELGFPQYPSFASLGYGIENGIGILG
jgi:hypothetical protein